MKKYQIEQLTDADLSSLCERVSLRADDVPAVVAGILRRVREEGDVAVANLTAQYDGVRGDYSPGVSPREIEQACERVPQEVRAAFQAAAANITKFHKAQLGKRLTVETMPGVTCFAEARPIERVGLYVPGGKLPLPSTVLMLGIPAKLAGCAEIVLVTPPDENGDVADSILFAANLCGITRIFKIGGAQAIAALAYGTQTVPKVGKIFGPGNKYVTAAKMLIAGDAAAGVAIDMPSGPTEVLVIADETARADFVASDLLSQAEHSTDAVPVLFTTNEELADKVRAELLVQLRDLPRKKIAEQALLNGFMLIVGNVAEAVELANRYAPEHLVLNVREPERYVSAIKNAGSVFLGEYACEAAGDYASGTNHSLPTYGYARAYGGVSVSSFQKQVTFQAVTKEGARQLNPIVDVLATEESLEAHRRAMSLRTG